MQQISNIGFRASATRSIRHWLRQVREIEK